MYGWTKYEVGRLHREEIQHEVATARLEKTARQPRRGIPSDAGSKMGARQVRGATWQAPGQHRLARAETRPRTRERNTEDDRFDTKHSIDRQITGARRPAGGARGVSYAGGEARPRLDQPATARPGRTCPTPESAPATNRPPSRPTDRRSPTAVSASRPRTRRATSRSTA